VTSRPNTELNLLVSSLANLYQHSDACNTMRWPPWSSKSPEGDQAGPRRPTAWEDSINVKDWKQYTELQNLVPTVLLTTTTLVLIHIYRNYLRRIPEVSGIQPGFFRKRSLFGRVTSVGDGDNFRLFHTPGGRLAGWGWFPGRRVPEKREDLKSRTVCTNPPPLRSNLRRFQLLFPHPDVD